jgi:hypothetical protein
MEIEDVKRLIESMQRLQTRSPYQTTVNPAYAGGDIATDDTKSGAAGSETNYSVIPFTFRPPKASESMIMLPYGANEKCALGQIQSFHSGKPQLRPYWLVPSRFPTAETTLATTGRAILLACLEPLLFTKVALQVTTQQSGSNATVKVYSSDGVLLWSSGNISTAGSGLISSTPASSSPVAGLQLNPGWFYIIEYTNSNGTVAVRAVQLSSNADALLNEGSAVIGSSASNVAANSSSNLEAFPMLKFY